jgi:putative flippase GtrA
MKKLLLQAVKFVGLSGIGWVLDFCTYTVLGFFSDNLVLNNIISSWIGVTFVFVFATRKVFKNESRIPLWCKYGIYLVYQCVLIYFISKLLNGINTFIVENIAVEFIIRFSAIISKILVTPVTMVLNFFVMKGVIEKI